MQTESYSRYFNLSFRAIKLQIIPIPIYIYTGRQLDKIHMTFMYFRSLSMAQFANDCFRDCDAISGQRSERKHSLTYKS